MKTAEQHARELVDEIVESEPRLKRERERQAELQQYLLRKRDQIDAALRKVRWP